MSLCNIYWFMYFIYCPILQNNSCKCFFIYFLNKVDIDSFTGRNNQNPDFVSWAIFALWHETFVIWKRKSRQKKAQKLGLPLKISLSRNAQRFVKAVIRYKWRAALYHFSRRKFGWKMGGAYGHAIQNVQFRPWTVIINFQRETVEQIGEKEKSFYPGNRFSKAFSSSCFEEERLF